MPWLVAESQLQARGEVIVPAGYISLFVGLHPIFAKPEILKTIAPDSFDAIQLCATAIDESEEGEVDRTLAFIEHLSGFA